MRRACLFSVMDSFASAFVESAIGIHQRGINREMPMSLLPHMLEMASDGNQRNIQHFRSTAPVARPRFKQL